MRQYAKKLIVITSYNETISFFIQCVTDILCYRQAANGLKQIVFKEVNVGVVVLNDFFNREFLFYQYSGGQ